MPKAVGSLSGHVSRAVDFYNAANLYFSIGKTTPWDENSTPTSTALNSDDNPPDPTIDDTVLELVGYKKVESKFLVYPDPEGEIVCNGRNWKVCTNPDDAVEKGARWVYLSSWLLYNELPTSISYRQIGVFSGLKKKDSVPAGKTALLPDEVDDPGLQQVLYNRKPIYRDPNQREQLTAIITF